jgi:hypothetical protein
VNLWAMAITVVFSMFAIYEGKKSYRAGESINKNREMHAKWEKTSTG